MQSLPYHTQGKALGFSAPAAQGPGSDRCCALALPWKTDQQAPVQDSHTQHAAPDQRLLSKRPSPAFSLKRSSILSPCSCLVSEHIEIPFLPYQKTFGAFPVILLGFHLYSEDTTHGVKGVRKISSLCLSSSICQRCCGSGPAAGAGRCHACTSHCPVRKAQVNAVKTKFGP